MLELKEEKGTDYITGWKSIGVYTSELTPSYPALLHNIKRFEYRIGMQFDNSFLVAEENDYVNKIVNVYIVLFGATNLRKIAVKVSGYIVAME